MNWDDYEIYHPGVFGPLHTLPRTEARRAFNARMEAKAGRGGCRRRSRRRGSLGRSRRMS